MLHRLLASTFIAVIAITLVPVPQTSALIWPAYGTGFVLKVRNPQRKKVRQAVLRDTWRNRNERRRLDVKLIANAFYNYRREHSDTNAPGITAKNQELCRTDAQSCVGLLDVREVLAPYMSPLRVDPTSPKIGNGTGYFVRKDWKGRIYVSAPGAEDDWKIEEMH